MTEKSKLSTCISNFFSLQIPERNAEGGHGKDAMRIKDFTYDFSFWSVDKNEPKYCSQKQVCFNRYLHAGNVSLKCKYP